jgi:hypothetical protein
MKNELRAYNPEGKTFFPTDLEAFKAVINKAEFINNNVLREALLAATNGGTNEFGEKESGVFKIEWFIE